MSTTNISHPNEIHFNPKLKGVVYFYYTDYFYTGELYHDGTISWYYIKHRINGNIATTNTHPDFIC